MSNVPLVCLFLLAGCRSAPLPSAESATPPDLGGPSDSGGPANRERGPVDLAIAGCRNLDMECIDLGGISPWLVDLARADRPFAYDLPPPVDLALGWCGGAFCRQAQYCLTIVPGMPGPVTYECRWVPAACGDQAACDCMQEPEGSCTSMNAAYSCQESGSRVTVTCAYP